MARKENTKAKEKKRERKLMELKMNFGSVCTSAWRLSKITETSLRWSKVKAAEMQENPLAALPSFTVFNKNGVNLTLETKKYGNNFSLLKNYSSKRMFHLSFSRHAMLSSSDKEWLFKLLERNMRAMYQQVCI